MMKELVWGICIAAMPLSTVLHSEEESAKERSERPAPSQELKEEFSETTHTIRINGVPLTYKATAGTLLLKDEKGKAKASIFYTAYTKQGAEDITSRPVTFCFNGGPGSSSVWLHMGVLGPKRVLLNEEGCSEPPYKIVDNEYSILASTDLVFIDPVSTGYSKTAPGEDAKQYYGYEEDIKSVGEFIRLYTTKFNRWDSPKFLAGESYGTVRAAGLVDYLHDELYMYFNGVILVSSVLNFQTIRSDQGNDLPYILFLPTYTATAWYHKKLPEDLQQDDLKTVLKKAQDFATNEFSLALFKGETISDEEYKAMVEKLANFTGLSQIYIDQANLRVPPLRYAKELLRSENRTVGRFDSRIKGIEVDQGLSCIEYDPSKEIIAGGFAASLNYYLHNDLKWNKEEDYKILVPVTPWNYGPGGNNQYLNVASTLHNVLTKNTSLQVFVACGYNDMATPYFAADYTFNHLSLDPAIRPNVSLHNYEGGHMMYTVKSSLVKLSKDLNQFVTTTCRSKGTQDSQNIKNDGQKNKPL
jgi:carboxypeptidase C (cathepsin A)